MEVRNVQSPSFGMLRAKAALPALRDSSTCTSKVVNQLSEAFDALKDTKFFHLEVGENLGCRIVGAKDAYFGPKSFERAKLGTSDNVVMVQNALGLEIYKISKQDRTIDKEFYGDLYKKDYKEYEAYDEYNDKESWFPVYGRWGLAFNTVDNLSTLVNKALQLDKVAVEKYNTEQKAAEDTVKINEQLQKDVDAFESKLLA